MFAFDFMQMSHWYERERDNPDYFQNDPNIFATILSFFEKYKTHQGAFIKQNIHKKNIRRVMFLKQPNINYLHGLYVVKQDDENLFLFFHL